MSTTLDLTGSWQFRAIDSSRRLPPGKRRCLWWMDARVPGTVHTDLLAADLIADPFYRMNESLVEWVEGITWLYRRTFVVPVAMLRADRVVLAAEGLDTYATIRCNGAEVGRTANMFVGHRFDVKPHLHPGTNVIEIEFDAPAVRAMALEKRHGRLLVSHGHHRVYVRKAQYSFGWDWGPSLATCGIWRNIFLEASTAGKMRHPFVKVLRIDRHSATIEISLDVDHTSRRPLTLSTTIVGGARIIEDARQCRAKALKFRLRIPDPRLWWPNGHGEQPMYRAYFSLRDRGDEVDRCDVPFALRTVRLVQDRDSRGKSFIFEVNGKRIFCKGADWIPADSFIPRITDSAYATLLRMAKEAHMNMIRVWGGGIYEQDIFYDLCDRAGLMVWQDFMYACGEYPEQPWFLREAKREAEEVVQRLRNHPSIVLWCGNNECEWSFCSQNPGKTADEMTGARIFRNILPEVCARYDGTRPYWRSSPFGEGFPNSEDNGNHHQWLVWSSWQDFGAYERNRARFVTEFGFQSPANRITLEEAMLPQDRHPQSEVMEHHNKQVEGTERLFRFLAAHYRFDGSWERFIRLGQLVQGEALKCAVEHWRRRKFETAGALFWQLNDCWPVSSWSVIDSALRPKAAYYFAKRFSAPVLVSLRRAEEGIEAWVTSDGPAPLAGTIELVWRSMEGGRKPVARRTLRIGADSSAKVMLVPEKHLKRFDSARWYLHAVLTAGGSTVSENRYFLREPKHLALGDPGVSANLRGSTEGDYRLTLKARRFAKNVAVEIEGEEIVWEDNYFDMDAGMTRTLRFTSNLGTAQLRKRLRIQWV